MIFGNPNNFAILVEPVNAWSDSAYQNGLMCFFVNGCAIALNENDCFCSVVMNSDLYEYENNLISWRTNPQDNKLFDADKHKAFEALMMQLWPEIIDSNYEYPNEFVENYTHYLSFDSLQQMGVFCFIVGKKEFSRILIGREEKKSGQSIEERFSVVDSVIEHREIKDIFSSLACIGATPFSQR